MLTVTTGQFVICIHEGHIAIELNGVSDCIKECQHPLQEQDGDFKSCSHCIDTVVNLREILKDKDNKNVCIKCIYGIPVNLQSLQNSGIENINEFSYLHYYKNFLPPYDQYNITTSVLLI